MPGTLDLDGATVTLTDDTVYTYYQITDTSVAHDGKLIIGAGTVLRFDNKAGAGFAALASAIEIYCNGTIDNNCAIISADPNAINKWIMPATSTIIDANYCEFSGQTGPIYADYWSFNACLFASGRLCSADDMTAITGTTHQRTVIGSIIEDASRDVTQFILANGLSTVAGYAQRNACIKLSVAYLLTRYRMDGTKPASLSIGGISMSDNIDTAIMTLTKEAYDILNSAGKIRRTWQTMVRKVNR